MISTVSGALAAGAARGKSAVLRNERVQRLIKAPILDWVIPSALVAIIVIALAWVIIIGN